MDAVDFIREADNEIKIANGDFVIGLSDEQHIEDLLIAAPGDVKQFPLVGVDISKAINGSVDGEVRKEIRLQLVADGYDVTTIDFKNGELNINAKRNN
jgi:hypothetical protein